MELYVGEDAEEDVLGENVLDQHLTDIDIGHVGADGTPAEGEEHGGGILVVGVASFRLRYRLPQVFQHGGQIVSELLAGLAELFDFRQIVVQETRDEAVQFAGSGHVHAHGLAAVLDQHGGLRV